MINQLKLESFPELLTTTYNIMRCLSFDIITYPSITYQPKSLLIHAGTNDAVKFISIDILNKLLQLKSFIQEKLRDNNLYTNTEIRQR